MVGKPEGNPIKPGNEGVPEPDGLGISKGPAAVGMEEDSPLTDGMGKPEG